MIRFIVVAQTSILNYINCRFRQTKPPRLSQPGLVFMRISSNMEYSKIALATATEEQQDQHTQQTKLFNEKKRLHRQEKPQDQQLQSSCRNILQLEERHDQTLESIRITGKCTRFGFIYCPDHVSEELIKLDGIDFFDIIVLWLKKPHQQKEFFS